MNEAENAQSGIGQRGKAFGQARTLGIVAILVPPTVLDEMQAVFHLPVVAHIRLKPRGRDRARIETGGEIAAVARKNRAVARPHFAIDAQRDAAFGKVQTLAEIVGRVEVEPKSAGFAITPLFTVVSWAGRLEDASAKQSLQGIENLGLIGLDLKQVIAAFAGENVQQRTLRKNGVAGEKLQGGIGGQQFGKMVFQAARLVRFVVADGPLIEGHFHGVQKNIEHLHGRTVGIESLPTGFAVDGRRPTFLVIGERRFEPSRKRLLELGKRKFGEDAGDGRVARRFFAGEPQRFAEILPMSIRPAYQHGHFRNPPQ